MKNFRLVMLLILNSVAALAATAEGINFENGTWKEITAKAKKENKLIFIDCYTSWCGPCKRLSDEVFPLKEVGDVFNKNFINYKIDMEKGEGIGLQKKFHVGAYPTLLWVSANGEVVYRSVGFVKEDVLLAEAKKALTAGSYLIELEKRYAENPNNPDVTRVFLNSLVKTADARAKEITEKYLLLVPKEKYLEADIFELMAKNLYDPFSPAGNYFFDNRSLYEAKFQRKNTDVFVANVFYRYINFLLSPVKNGKKFDENAFQKFVELMESQQFEKRQFVTDNLRVKIFEYQKNWRAYALKINSLLAEDRYQNISSGELSTWYQPVLASNCKDVEVLRSAVNWTTLSFKNDHTFSMSHLAKNLDAKVKLLERIPNSDVELLQAKTELAILVELEIKQQKFATDKAKTIKMIEVLSGKK